MRLYVYSVLILFFLCFASCKSGFEHNRAGMEKLNTELKNEFGADTWYTSIELVNNDGSDDVITVDKTNDPNSLKQEQWSQFHGFWDKKANITLSIQGAEPKAFMFQLDKEVSLGMMGTLMERSVEKIRSEKNADDAQVVLAQVRASNQMNSKSQGIKYTVSVESKKIGKHYHFVYNLDGSLNALNE